MFYLVWGSIALGYVFSKGMYFLGGGFGYVMSRQLNSIIGGIGTGILLVFSLLGFLVIMYNISFVSKKEDAADEVFMANDFTLLKPKEIKAHLDDFVIGQDDAKKVVKLVKDAGLKVQASIQDDLVRVTGKKIDDLQEVIQLCRTSNLGLPLQYVNMRD